MTENEFLSQEEIDKLLSDSDTGGVLTPEEKDMIGEIGNIAMGSAATTLSMILGRDIHITVPTVREEKMKNVKSDFSGEQVVVSVEYTEGLEGLNVLVLDKKLVAVIADLMMGGSGEVETEELDEIKLSAVGEAMNQMMGSAATSLSELLGITINISPPKVEILNFDDPNTQFPPVTDNPEKDVAVVEFEMEIEGLPKSKFYQVISADLVKKMYEYFTKKQSEAAEKKEKKEEKKVKVEPVEFAELKPSETRKTEVPSDKLELLLDIPLKVTVELGRTRMTLKRVLEMIPGSIIELDKLTGEPVDILVNGKLIARGEVVVIDENFGVRITEIVSPKERLELLNE
ncbi:chemotaxis protein CheC [Thermotoga maritima MSB8]|uniref:Flagellar motor switch protein FliN n=1 Tax=Thermotoga maritima (strain ATCC 43589 / DSM 3109 / JCM 10099 / NBRC 100826 / MSB8) TaxID=243274 RepID=A0ABF7PFY1_THEMA|nr:flagellar motor switch phosphatase FliY [Thermotoga maritima]AGL49605.1 Flagellar motor switch protein FliN [Thermotoga maritima MSB8]AHD17566.1 chemotaxis protein CheC [Thermotoga maritima MSB8]AKE26598.1 chemotaxis protein CheC [Thermotoga maritima]AKE28463.1 chemotaxis protein CheC [Thermotoga maritima MSB8]AKE30336.1 chemotaxis protein CheC [Thermotoga maritima]